MSKRIGRLMAAGVIATAIFGAIAIVPVAAQATTITCFGYGCDNKDPVSTGCSATAYTASSVPITIGSTRVGTLNNRYSTACGTNWSQVVITDGSTPEIQVQVCRAYDDNACSDEYTVFLQSSAYSNQMFAQFGPAIAYGWVTYEGAGTFVSAEA